MPKRSRVSGAESASRLGESPRWHTDDLHRELLRQGWQAWLQELARGYFNPQGSKRRAASMMIEGVAQGMAWLIAEATMGKRTRRSSRIDCANAKGDFGPGKDVHSSLVESIAKGALNLGRGWVRTELSEFEAAIAAQVITAAAAAAIDDVYEAEGGKGAARRLFLIEIQERLDADAPWLSAAICPKHE